MAGILLEFVGVDDVNGCVVAEDVEIIGVMAAVDSIFTDGSAGTAFEIGGSIDRRGRGGGAGGVLRTRGSIAGGISKKKPKLFHVKLMRI